MKGRSFSPGRDVAALRRWPGWILGMAGLCAGAADGQELLAENAYLGEVPVVLTVSRLA